MTQALPYSYITLAQARQQLANRLYDPTQVFWVAAELNAYIQEALQTWNALTANWRRDFTFQTQQGVQFYDLTDTAAMPNTLRPYTVTDANLYTTMLYHLLEPPTGPVSVQLTTDDLVSAVQRRRDELLSETSCTQTRHLVPAVAGRITLPDEIIDVRRMAYLPTQALDPGLGYGSGRYGFGLYGVSDVPYVNLPGPTVVWPEDTWAETSYNPLYPLTPAGTPTTPLTYIMSTQPPLSFDTDAPPSFAGSYELLTVDAGPALNFAIPQTLLVPDDWTHVIKWGALADLFNRESNAKDPLRAQYCVPLDSEILTKTGWKYHSDLHLGEQVMGYNQSTGKCEWTNLLAINLVSQQKVYTYDNRMIKMRCTDDHRWVFKKRGSGRQKGLKALRHTSELLPIEKAPSDALLVQAAMSPSGPGLGLIGIEEYLERGKAVEMVLSMTSSERRAFILGMMYGEGNSSKGRGLKRTSIFSQNDGPIYDAAKLACALEGISTSKGHRVDASCKTKRFTMLQKVSLRRSLHRSVNATVEDVWCPTTGLGTWVMRQGDMITITGNCQQRYEMGKKLLTDAPALLSMRISNVPLRVSTVRSSDLYDTFWEATAQGQPIHCHYSGLNLIALDPVPDAGIIGNPYMLTPSVVENAPIPIADGDFVQISRGDLDSLLDYCVHVAMVKCGGAEFLATMPLFDKFMSQAKLYNRKLTQVGEYMTTLLGLAQREKSQNPVEQPEEVV